MGTSLKENFNEEILSSISCGLRYTSTEFLREFCLTKIIPSSYRGSELSPTLGS